MRAGIGWLADLLQLPHVAQAKRFPGTQGEPVGKLTVESEQEGLGGPPGSLQQP